MIEELGIVADGEFEAPFIFAADVGAALTAVVEFDVVIDLTAIDDGSLLFLFV